MSRESDSRSHISRPGEQQSPDLPPMQDALLDEQTLAALVRDLNECAEIDDVMLKGDNRFVPGAQQNVSLDEAVLKLHSGEVHGVQVRYRFEGRSWCDTLMSTGDGVRLIRIEQQ